MATTQADAPGTVLLLPHDLDLSDPQVLTLRLSYRDTGQVVEIALPRDAVHGGVIHYRQRSGDLPRPGLVDYQIIHRSGPHLLRSTVHILLVRGNV